MDLLQKAVSLLQQQFDELQCSVNNRFEDIEKRMAQLCCPGESANSTVSSTEVCTLSGSKPTQIVDEFKIINNRISRLDDRLSKLENSDNNCSTSSSNTNNKAFNLPNLSRDIEILPQVATKLEDVSDRLLKVENMCLTFDNW